MRRTLQLGCTTLFFAVAMQAQTTTDSLLQPRPGEVLVGPRIIHQTVSGVPVEAVAAAFLSAKLDGERVLVQARIVADLGDLQQKIGALMDTLPWPTDNCAHFGADNVTVRVWGKELTVRDAVASLKLSGDTQDWACAKNPLRCSKLVEDEQTIAGVKVKVPRAEFFDCNPPIKTVLVPDQPLVATLPLTLEAADPHTVVLSLGKPRIELGGRFGQVTGAILTIAGVDVSARAKDLLDKALNPEMLKQTLPEELLGLAPTITAARFLDNAGRLAASLELSTSVAKGDLAALVKLLLSQSPGSK